MTEQLVFELAQPEPPSFANFVAAGNQEAIEALTRVANGAAPETGLVLWGAPGAGKTHLLRAAVAACAARGQRAVYLAEPHHLADAQLQEVAASALVALDRIDDADDEAQARIFTLYNALHASKGRVVVAATSPPAKLNVREDLRTRLGWGLVYEIVPLTDADKPAALLAYARQRGFDLAPDVVRYLLVHGRRDMTTLLATLAALDRHSLATKRAVTVPMLREWLQRDMPFGR